VTAFADVCFEAVDGIWFLDTLEGKVKHLCHSREDLNSILSTEEGMDTYLLAGLAERAAREGCLLGDGECYDFKVHPILGGAIDYSNIEKQSFLVALHLRGQLHDQVRNLPAGTKISKIIFSEVKNPKPWWKLW
jgi:hypothetical protein